MNALYLTIFVLTILFAMENFCSKYLLVNINENTKESFRKTNNEDRTILITNSFRAGNGGANKGNPSKRGPSKGGPTKREPSKNGPIPCKKKKSEECVPADEEGKIWNPL